MLKANIKYDDDLLVASSKESYKLNDGGSESFTFRIIQLPSFGKLQYRYDTYFSDFSASSSTSSSSYSSTNNDEENLDLLTSFTQNDIDQGI